MKKLEFEVCVELKNSNSVMNNSFWIGICPGLNKKMLDFIYESAYSFLRNEL